jgi:PAS domain S-box-containing protein
MERRRTHIPGPDEAQHAAEVLELGDAFLELDREWRIVQVNRRQELLSRQPRSELLGRIVWEVWPETATPGSRTWREYHRVMEERVPVFFREHLASLDLWTGVTAYPVSCGGIAVFFRDITELIRAEQALREREVEATRRTAEVEAVLGAVAEGLVVQDLDGRIIRSNAAADRLLGYDEHLRAMTSRERIASGRITWLREDGNPIRPDDLPTLRAAVYGETARGIVLGMSRADGVRWVSLSAAPHVVDGVRVGAVVSLTDVTARKRAEAAVQASERRLRRVIDVNPIGVVRRDGAGNVLYANDAYLQIVHATREDLEAGRIRWEAITAPEFVEAEDEAMAQADTRGASPVFEKEYVLSDGGRVPVLIAFASMGIPGELTGFVVDLTERKRAEGALRESEQRFRMLAEAMPHIVCVLSPDGRAEYVNRSWAEYSGCDLAATKEAGWIGSVHPDDFAAAAECRLRVLKTLAPQDVELRYRAADGTYRWFLCRLAPIVEAGRVTRFVGSAMDIEDRKGAELALRDADRRKDEFLGMLSHELRNPLAPIRNALYILDHAAVTGEQARRAKDVANRQITHVTRLVDDLLDVTRIARGKIELRRLSLDLGAVGRRAADDYRAMMSDRGLDLEIDVPAGRITVDGDETRLAQVLGNLLSNAAKFTPPGGKVTLAVRREGDRAVVHVRDSGPGIAPEVLPTIFEPFTQGKQTLARSEGGLGLGLSLVKGLVALHGGEVSVVSGGVGRGSDFAVSLPAVAAEQAEPSPGSPTNGIHAERRRVLVIDDNHDAADTLAELVTMLGHAPVVAYDAIAGLEKASEGLPDIVLCDIGLPGMDGYEFARQLRALTPTQHVRLVALSGYAHPEDVTRAVEAGFDAHVAKPPDPEKIASLIGGR